MTTIAVVCAALIGVAGLLCITRIVRGPSMLDRAVAADVLMAAVGSAFGIEAAINRNTTTLPILVVLALVGFLGSVSIARFAPHSRGEDEGGIAP